MRIFSTQFSTVAIVLGLSLLGNACNSSKPKGDVNTAAPGAADQTGVDQGTPDDADQVVEEAPAEEEVFTASIGVKNFRQLTATYETLTGVQLQGDVLAEYESQLSSLPTLVDASSLSSSQISAITKLAAAYCFALSNDQALRTEKFPNIDFANPPADSTGFATDILDTFYGPEDMLQGDRATDIATIAGLVDYLNTVDFNGGEVTQGTPATNIFTGGCAAALAGPEIVLY